MVVELRVNQKFITLLLLDSFVEKTLEFGGTGKRPNLIPIDLSGISKIKIKTGKCQRYLLTKTDGSNV
jgi:hypothetical protein